mmetsp:Transcript_95252/g.274337  ORF Transcript_95252/g.274337 Transcript_95252/m.274337 type:complete len:732 (-) Transcript_95252:36-2231(-)
MACVAESGFPAGAAAGAEEQPALATPAAAVGVSELAAPSTQSSGLPRASSAPSKSLDRKGSAALSRSGSLLQRAATLQMQRANSMPEDDADLRHAASMPGLMDMESDRPFCCGMWKTQQLVGAILGVVLVVVFLSVRVVHEYAKADAMIAVVCLTGCCWVFEVMPIYVTALLPAVLMPLFEITSTEIAARAYWHWVSMLFVGAFLIDVAMEHVNLPRRIMFRAMAWAGPANAAALLAAFMSVAWVLSMVCSDIAITLMLAPFVTSLVRAAEDEASSLDDDSAVADAEGGALRRGPAEGPSKVDQVRRFGAGLMLGVAYAASIGGIATTIGTPPNALLAGTQILAGHVSFGSWILFALPISFCAIILAYIALYFGFVRGIKLPLRREVLMAEQAALEQEIGKFSRDEMLVGFVQVLLLVLLCIQPLIDRIVHNPLGEPLAGSATTACLCAMLLFVLPSKVREGEALLTWRVAQEKVPWGVLLLMGGGFSLGQGFHESGLDLALGKGFGQVVPNVSPLALHFVIVFSVVLCIQAMNSIATAAWVLPMLVSASLVSVTNPLQLMLPATVACSFSFLLPTASPSNAVALGKSRDLVQPLRVRDFARAGLPLTVVVAAIGALLSYGLAEVVFDAHSPFPQWACVSPATNCIWAYVPGEVQGRRVEYQACIPNDADDDRTCTVWNGSVWPINEVATYGTPWGLAPEPQGRDTEPEESAPEPEPEEEEEAPPAPAARP